VIVKNYKGALLAVELILMDYIESAESIIGVELVYEGEIVANIVHATISFRKNSLIAFRLPTPVTVNGALEIRLFARSPVGTTKIMGHARLFRLRHTPIVSLVGRGEAAA
jgi:hypothetical protein